MGKNDKKDAKKGDKKNDGQAGEKPYDFFRHSPIRIFGYAGHIGGALRPFVPYAIVNISRALATAYICSDVIDKAGKERDNPKRVSIATGDALSWQLLASVIIPSIILSGATTVRCNLMCRQNYTIKRIAHTGVGLLAIALIMKPIDMLVDTLMDETYRKYITEEEEVKDKKGKVIKQ